MDEFQGIKKIQTQAGEFFTQEYVAWLEENLEQARRQVVSLTVTRNNLERQLLASKRVDRIDYEHGGDHYPDDEYDRS